MLRDLIILSEDQRADNYILYKSVWNKVSTELNLALQ